MEECIFDNMAMHIECRFNKNSLLQCFFLGILPAGKVLVLGKNLYRQETGVDSVRFLNAQSFLVPITTPQIYKGKQ